jgi:hypothetical protein
MGMPRLAAFALLSALLVASGCGAGRDASDPAPTAAGEAEVRHAMEIAALPAGHRLHGDGVSVVAPAGWDGRMLRGGSSGLVIQVANFELPEDEGSERQAELAPGEEDPIKAMGEGDVLISISAAAAGRRADAPIGLADLEPVAGPRVPLGHRLAAGSFCFGERCLEIELDSGGETIAAALQRRVNDVLASLSVASAELEPPVDANETLQPPLE